MNDTRPESPASFYVVGGTMRPDAPSYVERQADKELFAALVNGEFCYVLTPRQMGKSSLMIRTAARLRDSDMGVAVLDLTAIGQNLTVEQWYGGLIVQIGQRLNLEDQLIEFWLSHSLLGPMQRWVEAIRRVVLLNYAKRLVIFIDEIDVVRSLPFSLDELFAGIRECYNQRNEDLGMLRLTFCLLGVATPSDLMCDPRTTPFNIGRRIELNDFTQSEAAPLAQGLRQGEKQGAAILNRVLHWTGGHPCLTQRLCQAVSENLDINNNGRVDRLCEELFFSHRAQQRDDNLLFVRECILRSEVNLCDLLEMYARVRKNKPVRDDEANPIGSTLRLSGITRTEAGLLKVRNRIYSRVFDNEWVATNIPDAEMRRQRAAYRRGVWRTTIVSLLILSLFGWLAFMAIKQGNRAEVEAAANRRLLEYTQLKLAPKERQDLSAEKIEEWLTATIYHTQIKLALQAWDNSNIDRVEELLQASKPQPGQKDWRSFEWYWLWRLSHNESSRLKGEGQVASAIFLPDGQTLVVGEVLRAKTDGRDEYLIERYDWKSGRKVNSFSAPAGKNFDLVTFSPDKKRVAADGPNNSIIVRDIDSGEEICVFKGHQKGITAIAFSPDGKHIASGDFHGVVKLWEIAGGREKVIFKGLKQWIRWVAFSPDNRLLATTDETEVMRIWDTETGRQLQSLSVKERQLARAFFSPDGKKLVSTTTDGHLQVWDVRTRRMIVLLTGHTGEARSIAFSPDGKTFVTGSVDRSVRFWDADTGQELAIIRGHGSAVNSVAFSTDGKYLVTGGPDGTIKIWDTSAGQDLAASGASVARYFASIFSSDGDLIALGLTKDRQVRLWDLTNGQELARFDEAGDNILCAAFSHDGKFLATGGMDNLVRVWDAITGKQIRILKGHTAFVENVDFSPDGKLLISGGEDRALKLWDLTSGQELASLDSGVNNYYRAIFSPDSKMLASACRDGSVKLWDVTSRTILHSFVGHTDLVRAIAFSHDGSQLVTGGKDNMVRMWDVATGQELTKLGQSDSVKRIVFSLEDKRLVTGGEDGSVKLWDVVTRQELMTLKGHLGSVSSITFSADGMNLATTGNDGSMRLWHAVTTQ